MYKEIKEIVTTNKKIIKQAYNNTIDIDWCLSDEINNSAPEDLPELQRELDCNYNIQQLLIIAYRLIKELE